MQIIVISDNHGRTACLEDIRNQYRSADYFVHCGDSEMPCYMLNGYAAVKGNNDMNWPYPEQLILEWGTHHALILHGHRYVFLSDRELLVNKAKRLGCDIVCFGHTHMYEFQKIDGVYLLNPGSISHNRDGSSPCFAILTIDGDNVSAKRVNYRNDNDRY